MARATTAKFEELIIEVEFSPGSGSYVSICGQVDQDVSRTTNMDTDEVPDCDDESLPLSVERSPRSQEVVYTGAGVWALQSHQNMMAWWRAADTRVVRIRNAKVQADGSSGDTSIEYGPAYLTQLNNAKTKGKRVDANIQIEWDGVPSVITL